MSWDVENGAAIVATIEEGTPLLYRICTSGMAVKSLASNGIFFVSSPMYKTN